jgi:hypothetical protein
MGSLWLGYLTFCILYYTQEGLTAVGTNLACHECDFHDQMEFHYGAWGELGHIKNEETG